MTQFGVLPSSTSPAAKRIYAAGGGLQRKQIIVERILRLSPEDRRRRLCERVERCLKADRPLTIAHIASDVAKKHGLSVVELRGKSQIRRIAHARHEAFWRCRRETPYSTTTIGIWFGDRDHTTVIHGVSWHEKRMRAVA
jgi:chromosomal replication initiation ATPase DnaA